MYVHIRHSITIHMNIIHLLRYVYTHKYIYTHTHLKEFLACGKCYLNINYYYIA